MRARTVRAGNSTVLLWIGAMVVVSAGFTGLYALVPLLRGEVLAGIVFLVIGGAIALLGLGLLVAGWRTSARVDARGVAWSSGFGRRTVVPWEQVTRVLMPGRDDPGATLALQLRDGQIVPISPLRKHQSSDDSTGLSPWYLRAGAAVQEAHQNWWAQQNR